MVWRAKTQAEQARDFITGFLEDGFDDPGVRAKEAVERAPRFRQKPDVPTSVYLELKELRFDEALREGNTAGHSTHASVMRRSGARMRSRSC